MMLIFLLFVADILGVYSDLVKKEKQSACCLEKITNLKDNTLKQSQRHILM